VPTTHAPYHVPESGQTSASQATRAGGAARGAAAAGHPTSAGALALSPSDATGRPGLARSILTPANPHAPQPLSRRHTGPGSGPRRRRGWRDAMHPRARVARVHALASAARLGTGSQASGGQRWGTSGNTSGPAPLTGAFAEAATRCWRHHPPGQQLGARGEQTPATGHALRRRAPTLGRAVSVRRPRQGAFALALFLQTAGRRAGAPGASRDAAGMRRARAGAPPAPAAAVHAPARRGRGSLSPRACVDPRAGSCNDGDGRLRLRGRPLPRARPSLARHLGAARLVRGTV
jgi:hypothetical protein